MRAERYRSVDFSFAVQCRCNRVIAQGHGAFTKRPCEMTDGGRVLSFRSGLFTQCISIVTDGFGHDADRHRIGIKGFRPGAQRRILISERLRAESDRRRVLRFLTGFHSGVIVNRSVVVIRNAYIRRGSVRRLFADVGSSADGRAVPCRAVRRCFITEHGRVISLCFGQ